MTLKKHLLTSILVFSLALPSFAQNKIADVLNTVENLTGQVNDKINQAEEKLTEAEAKIQSICDSVKAYKKYIELLDSARIFNLPVGISGPGKNPNYSIAVDEVILQPGGALFNASMMIMNPFDGKKMFFKATNIPFSFSGGITGKARLELVTTKDFNICNGVKMTIGPGTYVEFDCSGFKGLNIKGKISLSGEKFMKVDANGDSIAGPLESYFETTINDWNNLFLSIQKIDPFKIKSAPEVIFSCTNLTIDYSDFRNPNQIVFPPSYAGNFPDGSVNLWRGVFIADATVKLDKKFKKKSSASNDSTSNAADTSKLAKRDSSGLVSFTAKNLLIDNRGFSGDIAANNLLTLNEGDMGSGWKFSLENFSMSIDASHITKAALNGQLQIPAFKDSTKFSYSAFIDTDGKYNFTVATQDNLDFNLFGQSKLSINKSSYISITLDHGKFKPVACLTGSLDISVDKMQLAGVRFEELRIATEAPVISIKNIAVDGGKQGGFSKFPLTINNIELKMPGDDVSLRFAVKLNLINSSDDGFAGMCDITLKAHRNGYKYAFDGVQINEIKVDIVKDGAFEIHGQIMFARGDSIYGDGFRGELRAKFASTFELQALAIFGNVRGNRYFFVDAFLGIKPGLQAGPITLFGFSGGLYYHMKQKPGTVDPNSFGASLSGLVYEPNATIGVGIMAGIKFGVVKEQLIDADVKFEIVFNASGGLNSIHFEGHAKCIVPGVDIIPDAIKNAAQTVAGGQKLPFSPVDAAISASVTMDMDFEKHSFHSMLEVFINVGPIIKGVGENGRAGWCVLHIDPDKWYLHIGSPTDPIGLKFLGLLEAKSYFMVGHNLPTDLPLNPVVADILHIQPGDLAKGRKESDLASGNGIAFGASFRLNTGDLTFLMFYASFDFGAGFDIMLIDYGKNSYCAGHEPSLGINGWYAKGQIYAYLKGKVGIKAKIFRKEKTFDILSIEVAALMRAEAPNPVYMLGIVGGSYSVFGGMIKGQCKFKMEMGEKCDIVRANGGGSPVDMPIIGDVTPAADASEVDIFTTPQAVFNIPVDRAFKVTDDNDISKQYRVKLIKLELATDDGTPVVNAVHWNADHSVVSMEPDKLLTPKNKFKLDVEIGFEELVGNNWVAMSENGQLITEKRSVAFTTGLLPDKIPASAVKYSYPVDRMYNFYKSEYPQAYMAFTRNISIFFTDDAEYTHEAQWVSTTGQKLKGKFTYNNSEKTVYMDVPTGLNNNALYSLNFVAIPINKDNASDRNVTANQTSTDLGDSTKMDITTKEAGGTISKAEDKTFFSYWFRTSKYNTVAAKLSTFGPNAGLKYPYYTFRVYCNSYEKWESSEIMSSFKIRAILSSTPWFVNDVHISTYKNYPWFGQWVITRDTSILGLPAQRNLDLGTIETIRDGLTDTEVSIGAVAASNEQSQLSYFLPGIWDRDYNDIRMYLANKYPTLKSDNVDIDKILKNQFIRPIKPGNYPVMFDYYLPGKNIKTSSYQLNCVSNLPTLSTDL